MDIATADAYFETRLHSEAWEQASPTDRVKALATAERQIGTLALRDDVPAGAKSDAVCEQALWLLAATDYQRKRDADMARGIIGRGVGEAHEYSALDVVRRRMGGIQICPEAQSLLGEWLMQYRMGELR